MTLALDRIADILEAAPRYGHAPDHPGAPPRVPSVAAMNGGSAETDRYIRISDAMAREIAASLRRHARGESPRAEALQRR